jgi:CheY-like chemotaxis protein
VRRAGRLLSDGLIAAGRRSFALLASRALGDNRPTMPTILVAEDSADARRPIVRLLKGEGYDVLCAGNALETLSIAQRANPDLILLDVGMPPFDGLTVLSRLRDGNGGNNVPVIIVTGMTDELTHRRAEELGVKEYLLKAHFTSEYLLNCVRRHVRSDEDSD